jgi:2-hydroxychromene-2-carboxylate isomerase
VTSASVTSLCEQAEPLAEAAGEPVKLRPFLLGPVFLSLGWNDSPGGL